MVIPLIVGAARVVKTKSALKKAGKTKGAIAHQRRQRLSGKAVTRMRPSRHHQTDDERHESGVSGVRNILPHKNILRKAKKSSGKITVKKAKALSRGVMVLGNNAFPMLVQSMFGLLFISSIALEDTWLGWVAPGEAMALFSWLMCIVIGTYTMLISGFAMQRYLKDQHIVFMYMVCFILNWVPFAFVIPWAAIWVAIVIKKQ